MTHELRIKVAALATALFVAVISAAGLGLRHPPREATQAAATQQVSHVEHENESEED